MLSKFLLTLAVIIAAFLVLRQRKLSTPATAAKPRSGVDTDKASKARKMTVSPQTCARRHICSWYSWLASAPAYIIFAGRMITIY